MSNDGRGATPGNQWGGKGDGFELRGGGSVVDNDGGASDIGCHGRWCGGQLDTLVLLKQQSGTQLGHKSAQMWLATQKETSTFFPFIPNVNHFLSYQGWYFDHQWKQKQDKQMSKSAFDLNIWRLCRQFSHTILLWVCLLNVKESKSDQILITKKHVFGTTVSG